MSVRCNGLLRGCSHLGGVLAAAEPAVDAAPDLAQDGHARVPAVLPRGVLAQRLPGLACKQATSLQLVSDSHVDQSLQMAGNASAAQQILAWATQQAQPWSTCKSLACDE